MTVRVAVIGVGAMGRNHARVYRDLEGVELAAVADPDREIVDDIADRYSTRAYTDPIRMIDECELDAASVAVPTVDHLSVALALIERGVNLLVEKPIAFEIEEAERIISAADEKGVGLMVGHIERFNPAVIELKRRLDAGQLGRVYQLSARREGPFPSRIKDVGVVIDLAVHDLDLMRYITGTEAIRVYAETERKIHSDYEDSLSGLVRFEGGVVGSLAVNWLTPTKIRELHVTGEKGMFRVDYLTQDLYFYENAVAQSPDWDTLQIMRGVSEGQMVRHVVNKREPLQAELEAFLEMVQGERSAAISGEDGLRALQLASALVDSGKTGEVVKLGELA